MALVGCVVMLLRSNGRLTIGIVPLACVAFAGWLVVGLRVNEMDYPDSLVWPVISLLVAAAAGYVGLACQRSNQPTTACVVLALLWVVASCGTALVQWFQLFNPAELRWWALPRPHDMQPFGNLAQRNHAAAVHAMAMFSWAFLLVTRPSMQVKLLATVGVVLAMTGLVMTGSRIGSLLGIIAGLGALVLYWRQFGSGIRIRTWVIASLFAFAAYLIFYLVFQEWVFSLPSNIKADSAATRWATYSTATRQALWELAWSLFASNPLSGMGWSSFSKEALTRVDELDIPQFATNSHNLVSHLAAETGLVGLVLVLVPIAVVLTLGVRKTGQAASTVFPLGLVSMGLVYSITEFPLWNTFFLLPFVFTLGLLDRPLVQVSMSSAMRYGLALLCALLLAGSLYAMHRYVRISTLVWGVFRSGEASVELRQEVQRTANSLGFSQQAELLTFGLVYVDQRDLKEKIRLGNRVVSHQIDAFLLQKQASLLALDGQTDAAVSYIVAACRFYPERCDATLRQLTRLSVMEPLFKPVLTGFYARRAQDARIGQSVH